MLRHCQVSPGNAGNTEGNTGNTNENTGNSKGNTGNSKGNAGNVKGNTGNAKRNAGNAKENTENASNAMPLLSHSRNAAKTHNSGDTQTECRTLQTNPRTPWLRLLLKD